MTPDECWLASLWPFVRGRLPAAPARVIEVGCGPLGGFVPAMRDAGYDAVGIDPEAPQGDGYHQVEFEQYAPSGPVGATVACTSLHHVADLDLVLDRVAAALAPGGTLVVVEWAWERFDEATAQWCFARLGPVPAGEEPGWLHRRRDEWQGSGQTWEEYLQGWAAEEGLHPGHDIVRRLDARFERLHCTDGPYFFCDLAGVAEADEQAAIDAGQLRPTGIRYAGRA